MHEAREISNAPDLDGISYLRVDDQLFIEAIAEWLHEDAPVVQDIMRDGERRRALCVFQRAHHADIVMRELAQLFDLRHPRRSDYVTADGTLFNWLVWTGRMMCGRYYDAIFMHPTVDHPLAYEPLVPATNHFYDGR